LQKRLSRHGEDPANMALRVVSCLRCPELANPLPNAMKVTFWPVQAVFLCGSADYQKVGWY